VKIAGLGEHVRLGQCKTAARLFEVDPSPHPGLNALLNLVEQLIVLGKVFLRQQDSSR